MNNYAIILQDMQSNLGAMLAIRMYENPVFVPKMKQLFADLPSVFNETQVGLK